jgi:hypothetical protein
MKNTVVLSFQSYSSENPSWKVTTKSKRKEEKSMGTYDHKQVFTDYAAGKIEAETAIGHGLQHIIKLYDAQAAANLSRYELRGKVDTLEHRVNALQATVDRLTGLLADPRQSDSADK